MLGLDFETYCDLDLRVVGLDRYVNHPSFEVLLASVAEEGMPTVGYDFVRDNYSNTLRKLHGHLAGESQIVAQNAPFERAVCERIGLNINPSCFLDSAVFARAMGAASKLEAAAPQLVNADKMEEGRDLIRLFSMPQKDGTVHVKDHDVWSKEMHEKFDLFMEYCDVDAELGLKIASLYHLDIPVDEWAYEMVTQRMNDVGWHVDLNLVREMQELYQVNLADLEYEFRLAHDPAGELNFRSPQQLARYCKERGVRVTSLDEQHLARYLARCEEERQRRIAGQKPRGTSTDEQLGEVIAMLATKKELGGSSLSKLQTILNTVGEGDRLRGQYMHVGAGQSFRTSGRGVQMQNLKRLGPEPDDVAELFAADKHYHFEWDNARLARNLRQVFTAGHPDGKLIVGDFSSVESRGLAYLAGEKWKLRAYEQGKDLYKVLASSMLGVSYEQVTKPQRQQGKVGELSCGYGAGPGAVHKFATKMGMELTEEDAAKIVVDWREANPHVVELWAVLDRLLHDVVEHGREASWRKLANGNLSVGIVKAYTPMSLRKQSPRSQTIRMQLVAHRGTSDERTIVDRWFQGCFILGKDVCYHKPSETKSGDVWRDEWTKDGQRGRYKIYGGKLVGILTQSFCRELFFSVLLQVSEQTLWLTNVQLVGQFHDEIVLEWTPPVGSGNTWGLIQTVKWLESKMTDAGIFTDFPLEAEVKYDYRYTK